MCVNHDANNKHSHATDDVPNGTNRLPHSGESLDASPNQSILRRREAINAKNPQALHRATSPMPINSSVCTITAAIALWHSTFTSPSSHIMNLIVLLIAHNFPFSKRKIMFFLGIYYWRLASNDFSAFSLGKHYCLFDLTALIS